MRKPLAGSVYDSNDANMTASGWSQEDGGVRAVSRRPGVKADVPGGAPYLKTSDTVLFGGAARNQEATAAR